MILTLKQNFLIFILLSILSLLTLPSKTYAEQKEYIVGVVPQFETRRLHKIWQPILDYLYRETGHKLILRGSPTIPDFEKEFMQGKFDFAYMNPYHVMLANKFKGYIPLVRDKGRTLYGVLVTRKDNNINSVTDLKNQTIAFPAPNALGASLQIRQELQDKFKIPINPIYVKTHDSVYLSVLLGEAAAGGGVQKTLNNQPKQYRAALKILHTTQKVVPHPFAAHPRVSLQVQSQIQQALLKLSENPQGRKLLAQVPIKKIGTASMDDYMPLEALGLDRFFIKSN